MPNNIVAMPQASTASIQVVAQPKGMQLMKWVIIIVVAFRIIILCIFTYIFTIAAFNLNEQHMYYLLAFVTIVCVMCEMVGIIGAAHKCVCAIKFYFGYIIGSYVLQLLAVVLYADQLKIYTANFAYPSVLTILYCLLVYFFLEDCKIVQQSRLLVQQQQQASNVV